MNNYVFSPLNYMGNKSKLLPQILSLFPANIKTFVEPFCGSLVVGLNVNAEKYVFNDVFCYLIDLFEEFYNNNENDILRHIHGRIEEYSLSATNKEGYLKIRSYYNANRNPLDLYVLCCYCFSNQIRFNNKHEFNQSFGLNCSYFNKNMKSKLKSFLSAMKKRDISFSRRSFEELDFTELGTEDFVYLDPPYLISSATYNDGKRGFTGWNETYERKLLGILDNLNRRNIRFALSNVITHKGRCNEILLEWVKKNRYNVHHLNIKYALNRTGKENIFKDDEVFITNYD